jgi:YidC/Oxa1 family membrane protein insertase
VESAVQSETATELDKSSTSGIDSVPSDIPADVSIANFVPPPLQFGDFTELGLAGWGPVGIVARSFEWINVSTGMPWFYTIIAGTIFWRLVMLYPLVAQLRMTARLKNAPQISDATEELAAAKASGDQQTIVLASQKARNAYKDADVSIVAMSALAFVQLSLNIALFFALKSICGLPLEQMKRSGVNFLSDLTLASGTAAFDPYYIMPILGVIALNLQLKVCKLARYLIFTVLRAISAHGEGY